jgi:hypothetical protein
MNSIPPSEPGECQNCHCVGTLAAAITTQVASLHCRACGHVFEVEVATYVPPATQDAWFAQPPTDERLLECPALRSRVQRI